MDYEVAVSDPWLFCWHLWSKAHSSHAKSIRPAKNMWFSVPWGAALALKICAQIVLFTHFWAGPPFPENFHTFLLFSHRSLSESSGSRNEFHTDFCCVAQKSVWRRAVTPIFLWTDVGVSAEMRAKSWRFKSDWCKLFPSSTKIVFSTRRVAGSIAGCTFSVCAKSAMTDFHTDFPREEKSMWKNLCIER